MKDQRDDKEQERRRDEALRRALAMPPKRHKDQGGEAKRPKRPATPKRDGQS